MPHRLDVFINCPFDDDYRPLFHALVFAVHDCGFKARCALETDDGSETRFEKVLRIVRTCPYGIHDISRTELDFINNLPRFNMPLELGIFLGAKHFGKGALSKKRALILDREPYRYQKYISDLAGVDIRQHANDPTEAIKRARDWLSQVSQELLPSGSKMVEHYQQFQEELPSICAPFGLNAAELIFNNLVFIVVGWLRKFESDR